MLTTVFVYWICIGSGALDVFLSLLLCDECEGQCLLVASIHTVLIRATTNTAIL